MIQRGVETGNHFDGKAAKIVILATANGDELVFGSPGARVNTLPGGGGPMIRDT